MATGIRPGEIKFRYFDNNGNPLSGGKVFTYVSGTTTPLSTFANVNGTAFNANPVILDSAGFANIFLQPNSAYRFVVKDANDVTITTQDNVTGEGGGAGGGGGVGVSVRAYGAIGDGITDDTQAILEAMEAASENETVVYFPAGTYKITSTLNNSGVRANCRGFVGDTGDASLIDGFELTGDAILFTDLPPGCRFEHFGVNGPGQAAEVTSCGLNFPLSALNNIYSLSLNDVRVNGFPTAGFKLAVPITSSFNNLVAQSCGDYGFWIYPKSGVFVGGTSTAWQGCYANNVLGRGYYFLGHGYFSMQSCAADNCNVSYYFENSYCASLNGLGTEANTYIDASNPGVGIYLKAGYGFNIKALWSYNLPNVASRQIIIDGSSGNTIQSCSGYSDNGVTNAYECEMIGFGEGNVFLQNYRIGNNTAPNFYVAPTWRINEVEASDTMNIADGNVSGLSFDTPDEFGNSLYVRNGALTVYGELYNGLNLFENGINDYPKAAFDNSGTLSFGIGTAAQDVYITRSGIGSLLIGGTAAGAGNGSLSIEKNLTTGGTISAGDSLTVTKATYAAVSISQTTDTVARLSFDNNGIIAMGPGNAIQDLYLTRSAPETLRITNETFDAGNLAVDDDVAVGADLTVAENSVIRNLAFSNQTLVTSADVTLTGWDTSTFNYVSGGNSAGAIGVNAAGTPSTNPTIKVTYKSPVPPSYSVIPVVMLTPYQSLAAGTGHWQLVEQTATYFTAAYIGTPSAGQSYGFNYLVFNL